MGLSSELRRPLDPDPALWEALGGGSLLQTALTDFYARVFDDARLGTFFKDVTREWVAQKQFSFMKSILTGDNSYFGYRPRNAHHWMVISDDLFDYREDLMASCLREAGVDEPWVGRIREISEAYRKQIVKGAPWPRKVAGTSLPMDGYDPLKLECGAVCDGCVGEIEVGADAMYHRRTGKLYCMACMSDPARASS